jgi:hypothetical protein
MAMADGRVAAGEMARLAEARQRYGIPMALHQEILRSLSGSTGAQVLGIGAQRLGWIDLQAHVYGGTNGWLFAAAELDYDLQPAMAWSTVRLIACHVLQSFTYFLALHSAQSAQLLSPLQWTLGRFVAVREAVYLAVMVYAAIVRPAVLLVQLDAHPNVSVRLLDKLYYVFAPEKFMVQPVLGYSLYSTNGILGEWAASATIDPDLYNY